MRFSSFFSNLLAAFFIWLVGIVVFVPLSWSVSSPVPLELLVSVAFLILVGIFVSRSVREGKVAIDAYDDIRSPVRDAKSRSMFKNCGYLSLIAIAGMLVVPLMWIISGALGGIALVVVVFAAILVGFPLIETVVDRAVAKTTA